MKRKTKFTFNEHVQLANDLDGMRTTVMQHITRISESYPKTSRQVKCALKILKSIDSLRSEMDNVFYREYPGAQYRSPNYSWIHTPYYNSKSKNHNQNNGAEQHDE
jgi:hypothetical protein